MGSAAIVKGYVEGSLKAKGRIGNRTLMVLPIFQGDSKFHFANVDGAI